MRREAGTGGRRAGLALMGLALDVQHAVGAATRGGSLSAWVVVTLALGIGASTAVFSVAYGVLIRPLPYASPDSIVRLSEEYTAVPSARGGGVLSNLTYYAWTDGRSRALDSIGAYRSEEYVVELGNTSLHVRGAEVTPSLFVVLGTRPALGRYFDSAEGREGENGVVVLSSAAWRNWFNSDPSVVGRVLRIWGIPHTIVGVARATFFFPDRQTELWTPMVAPRPFGPNGNPAVTVFPVLGRLRQGATLREAENEGTKAAAALSRSVLASKVLYGADGPVAVRARTLASEMTSAVRPILLALGSGVTLVLLVACANSANLLLTRGAARRRELAMRSALGAGPLRLMTLQLTESTALAIAGTVVGLGLASAAVAVLPTIVPAGFSRLEDIRIDLRVFAFGGAAALVSGLLSGFPASLRACRGLTFESLKEGDRGSFGNLRGKSGRRTLNALVIGEVAFATVLAAAAVLLTRSFVAVVGVDRGFSSKGVLSVVAYLPGDDAAAATRRREVIREVLEHVRSLPGIAAAGATNMMPLDGLAHSAGFPVPGDYGSGRAATRFAEGLRYAVTPGYAEALGLRLLSGRVFQDGDLSGDRLAWVVNEEFARLYLPPHPIGRRFPWARNGKPIQLEIIGVVRNVLKEGYDRREQPEFYAPLFPDDPVWGAVRLVVRTTGDPNASAHDIRRIFQSRAPEAAVDIIPLSERSASSVSGPRFAMTVMIVLAALAGTLAASGVYAVMSYSVASRRRELGLRAALGATPQTIVRLVVGQALRVLGVGLLVGLVSAVGAGSVLRTVLFLHIV